MELAGFYISPAERLRVMKVIRHFKEENLHSPEQLKYLLCPIIAQGKADQDKFYELWDQYWTTVEQPFEIPPLSSDKSKKGKELNWWEKHASLLRWLIVSLILGGLAYLFFHVPTAGHKPLKAAFRHPPKVNIGESIYFENLSENHDSLCHFHWEIFDDENYELWHSTKDSFHLTHVISDMDGHHEKRVRLSSIHPERGDTAVFESRFKIVCNNPPTIDSLSHSDKSGSGQPVDFKVFIKNEKDLRYHWTMGDGEERKEMKGAAGISFQHSYQEDGQYNVLLNIVRDGAKGFCEFDTSFTVNIGSEKAILADLSLQRDPVSAVVNFSYSLWILLGLLGLPIIWFWVKWATRPTPKIEEEDEGIDMVAAAARFQSPDKGPYKIPFRANGSAVRIDKDIFRLADVMRQRQEGLRKEINIQASLKKTIDDGGFLQLITRSDEVPTEYLFLIDEQVEGSHQRHLFEWLVSFLQKREVYGEWFYYNEGLRRFWNEDQPKGITPSQLSRQFAFHKLVVLGNGHEFVSTAKNYEKQRPEIRSDAAAFFGHWKHRFLLTPMPVVSWTFREGVLHDRFAIFPMDTQGLNDWLKYLEAETEDEERPPYKLWSKNLLTNRSETNVNYRQWDTDEAHQDYLKNHPNLYKWLCAIALYPQPDWDVSLAIGRALSPVGVDVTYGNILVLSHVPWLINGDLNPRLRHQLIDDLDPQTEQLAREAIKEELELVADSIGQGFANLEHKTNLALQSFALNPKDAAAQKGIQELKALGLLTPRHLVEINQVVSKQLAVSSGQSVSGQKKRKTRMDRNGEKIDDFIEKNKPKKEPPKKPFFTSHLWWALGLSLLFVGLLLTGYKYGGTDKLAEWAEIDISESADCQDEYHEFYFLKKECIADSAVIYNNEAVNLYSQAYTPIENERSYSEQVQLYTVDKLQQANAMLEKAIAIRPNYELAILNLNKLKYNQGVNKYRTYMEGENIDKEYLKEASTFFKSIDLDTLKSMAMHGEGLSEFYYEKDLGVAPAASFAIYENIMRRDSMYFDSLEMYPHLQSLLAKDNKNIFKIIEVNLIDAESKDPIKNYSFKDENNLRFKTNREGKAEVKMYLGERRTFNFNQNKYEKTSREFIAKNGVYFYDIELKKNTPTNEVKPVPTGNTPFCYVHENKLYKGSLKIEFELIKDGKKTVMPSLVNFNKNSLKELGFAYRFSDIQWAEEKHNDELVIASVKSFEESLQDDRELSFTYNKNVISVNESMTYEFRFKSLNDLETDIGGFPVNVAILKKGCTMDESNDEYVEKSYAENCFKGYISTIKYMILNDENIFSRKRPVLQKRLNIIFNKLQNEFVASSCIIAELLKKNNSLANLERRAIFSYDELEGLINKDRDEDGVEDYKDNCPDEKGTAENNGCPIIDDGTGEGGDISVIFKNKMTNEAIPFLEISFYNSLQQGSPPEIYTTDAQGVLFLDYEGPNVVEIINPNYESFSTNDFRSLLKNNGIIYLEEKRIGAYFPMRLNLQDASGEPLIKVEVEVTEQKGKQKGEREKLVSDENGEISFMASQQSEFYISVINKWPEPVGQTIQIRDFLENQDLKFNYQKSIVSDLDYKKGNLLELLKELEANMVSVKGGKFQMGCDPKRDGKCRDDELPMHEVELSDFYIGKYEVTQRLWAFVMDDEIFTDRMIFGDGCTECPVENVSWDDIQYFLQKLNESTGQKYRLPTEAEWEYAARGGSRSKDYQYSGSNELNEVAWYGENSADKTYPVGRLQPNELGLYDMSGNVWEWCSDWYGEEYYQEKQKGGWSNPQGPEKGDQRMVRGGSWLVNDGYCRIANRSRSGSGERLNTIGFRLARY